MYNFQLYIAIILFSSSALAFEISLTRIFSIAFSYHFAFMIITIAMLGIGLSGTILSLYPILRRGKNIPIYGVFLGLSMSLSFIISKRLPFDPFRFPWDKTQFIYIVIYWLLISLPFFFLGLCISTILSVKSEKSGYLYASDLIGAGTGSIVIFLLMKGMPPEKVIVLISFLSFTGSFLIATGINKIIPLSAMILNLIFLLSPGLTTLKISPYKGLELALKYPKAEHLKTFYSPFSRIDLFKSPAIRYAPGLSLTYLDPLPYQTGISIDCGDISAVTVYGNRKELRFLEYLPSALPYELAKKDVLIIEPKGGLEVLLANYYGSKNIFKVEIDPLLINVVKRELGDISPGIFDINTQQGSGRAWIKSTQRYFDLIDIPFMTLFHPGTFGIGEDYRFTVEAFESYLKALKKDGLLSITLFITPPPRMELRIMDTLIEAAERIGLKEIHRSTAVIRTWDTVTIIVKKSVFEEAELQKIRTFLNKRRFDIVYLPGVKEEETNRFIRMDKNEYFMAFKSLLTPGMRKIFKTTYAFDISYVTDNSPFFYYFINMKKLKEIYHIMGKKWQFFIEEGLLPFFLLIPIMPFGLLIIIMPALSIKKRPPFYPLVYFSMIGIGFMFVEVTLIHRMVLLLENPSYAFATVLTSLLLWSGIGSMLSQKMDKLRITLVTIVLFITVIFYNYFVLPVLLDQLHHLSITYRIIAIFFSLSALGLLMGFPFPSGIKRLGAQSPDMIPWAWAVNGFFSVLSPILAMILAISMGFEQVLLIGAIAYLIASFLPLQS